MEIFGVYLVNQSSGVTTSLHQDQENIIGRGIPNPQGEKGKVLLAHPSISKIHAQIILKPETHEWMLYDKSRHGIYVNGKKINKETRLMHGDKIKVGPFDLMFYEKFKADDETSEQPLPLREEGRRWESVLLYFVVAILVEIILSFQFPQYLLIGSLSLFIFTLIFFFKSEWREKSRISLRLLLMLSFLTLFGFFLSLWTLWNQKPS